MSQREKEKRMKRKIMNRLILFLLPLGLLAQDTPTVKTLTFQTGASVPPSCSVSIVGTPGSKTRYFWPVANYPVGQSIVPVPIQIDNEPQTLSVSNYVQINCNIPQFATSVSLLKSTTPTMSQTGTASVAVGINSTTGIFLDQGAGLQSYTFNLMVTQYATERLNNRDFPTPRLEFGIGPNPQTLVYGPLPVTSGGTGTIVPNPVTTGMVVVQPGSLTTDSTAAFQAAIATCSDPTSSNFNGMVIVPPGSYQVNGQLTWGGAQHCSIWVWPGVALTGGSLPPSDGQRWVEDWSSPNRTFYGSLNLPNTTVMQMQSFQPCDPLAGICQSISLDVFAGARETSPADYDFSPVAKPLSGAQNVSGKDLVISGGLTTGTGAAGRIVFALFPAGASGGVDNVKVPEWALTTPGDWVPLLAGKRIGNATNPIGFINIGPTLDANNATISAVTTAPRAWVIGDLVGGGTFARQAQNTYWGTCIGQIGAANPQTYFLIPGGGTGLGCLSNLTLAAGTPMPTACIAQKLIVTARVAGAVAGSGVVTLYRNGATSPVTCTLGTTLSCNSAALTQAFSAGETWGIGVATGQAADTTADVRAAFQCL